MKPVEGRRRVVIEEVQPQVDCGRYPAKRILGDVVTVTSAIFGDGHDHVAGRLFYRHSSESDWLSTKLTPLPNDLWTVTFTVDKLGDWLFTIEAWIDHFATWCADLQKRLAAQPSPDAADDSTQSQNIPLALQSGAILLNHTAQRAKGHDSQLLAEAANRLNKLADSNAARYEFPLSKEIVALAAQYPDLTLATRYHQELHLWVDRERARYSTWYELFPRSTSPDPTRPGTFADVKALLPTIAAMGFNVLYLPPIHPIGNAFRKGRNNSVTCTPDDPGSPWAIGSKEGGHKSIAPELGTLRDFNSLVAATGNLGMELALDIAFQCSPDHPWVAEHPDWFVIRPDGSIQYAENPPKKYQDVYPFDFESADRQGLWGALKGVFEFWCEHGVRVFRVDNPHTKPIPFWEWCLGEIHARYPDTIFLAEAFTRPKLMYALAKSGFSQSYTYFTWRTTKRELEDYATDLRTVRDFFRPNFWPTTPDIFPEHLETGGRPAFVQRLVLAATLAQNYGIYGPSYELGERVRRTGVEELARNEKYEVRAWNLAAPESLRHVIARVNQIRRSHPALQRGDFIAQPTDNELVMAFARVAPGAHTVLVIVNLDPFHTHRAWVTLDLAALGLAPDQAFAVDDLLGGAHFTWRGAKNFVELDPQQMPAHIFELKPHVRTEHDFEYFL